MASMHDSVRFKTTVYAAIELSKKWAKPVWVFVVDGQRLCVIHRFFLLGVSF